MCFGCRWAFVFPKLSATPASSILQAVCHKILVSVVSKDISTSFTLVKQDTKEHESMEAVDVDAGRPHDLKFQINDINILICLKLNLRLPNVVRATAV